MAPAPERNREPQKVDEQGESTLNLPSLPGAPDPVVYRSSPSPQTLSQGGRRGQTEEGSGCHLHANLLGCYADEGSYANICPPGRWARMFPSLIWGPGAGGEPLPPWSLLSPLPPDICSLPLQLLKSPLTNVLEWALSPTGSFPETRGHILLSSIPPFPLGKNTTSKHVLSTASVQALY